MTDGNDWNIQETATGSDLADLLDQHREQIVSTWLEKFTDLPGCKQSKNIPEELYFHTENGVSALIRSLESGSLEHLEVYVDGVSRFLQQSGLNNSDIVQALLMLEESAIPVILEASSGNQALSTELVSRLNRCMRMTVAHFIALHAEPISNPLQLTGTWQEKPGFSEILRIVCSEGQRLTGAEGSAVLVSEEGGLFKTVLEMGDLSARPDVIIDALWPGSDTVLPDEPEMHNDFQVQECPPASGKSTNSLLVVPLRESDKEVGLLLLMNNPEGFGEDELHVIGMFSDWAATALNSARLREQRDQRVVLEDRQRLSRDLHDLVTQSLYTVTLYAEAAARSLSEEQISKAAENLIDLRNTALEALREMRLLVFELKPHILDEESLISALHTRLASVEERIGIITEFEHEGVDLLPREIGEHLYCIAREALNNSLKHAQATSVAVTLKQSGSVIILEIRDDGRGFDVREGMERGGMGLKSMEERALKLNARLTITSNEERGTQVRVEVPFNGDS